MNLVNASLFGLESLLLGQQHLHISIECCTELLQISNCFSALLFLKENKEKCNISKARSYSIKKGAL